MLKSAITDAIKIYLRKTNAEESMEEAQNRIKTISCRDCDLTDFIESERATLMKLNSSSSPILDKGLSIEMTRPPPETTEDEPSKKLRCCDDILMRRTAIDLEYLEADVDVDNPNDTLDKQIMLGLYDLYRDKELGYADGSQKKQLMDNTYTIKNSLCYINKYWKALFRAEFPCIPRMGSMDQLYSRCCQVCVGSTGRTRHEYKLLLWHINTSFSHYVLSDIAPFYAGGKWG